MKLLFSEKIINFWSEAFRTPANTRRRRGFMDVVLTSWRACDVHWLLLWLYLLCFFTLLLAGQLTFGFYYRGNNGPRDTPALTGLRNDRTSGITSCIWFYPTNLRRRNSPTLFQYMLDYSVNGFTVGLMGGSPTRLEIYIGGVAVPLRVDFPLKIKKWCQLCISWYRGITFKCFLLFINYYVRIA